HAAKRTPHPDAISAASSHCRARCMGTWLAVGGDARLISKASKPKGDSVPKDGIEPLTRGFSIEFPSNFGDRSPLGSGPERSRKWRTVGDMWGMGSPPRVC